MCACWGETTGLGEAERSVFHPVCLGTTQKDTWRLGYSHPAALQSLPFPTAVCFCRVASGWESRFVRVCRRNEAGRQQPWPPSTPHPCGHPGSGHGRCRLLPEARRRSPAAGREPRRATPGRGSRAFLETRRSYACVVICNLIYRDVRKKDDIGAVGGGATIWPGQSPRWTQTIRCGLSSSLKDLEVNRFPAPGCLCLDVVKALLLCLSFGSNITAVSL